MGKRKAQRIPEILSADEQTQLMAQFDSGSIADIRGLAIVRVLLDTGLRAAELINLKHRDLNLETGRLWVRQGKNSKDRGLWFNGGTRAALEAYFCAKPSGAMLPASPVFCSLDGKTPLCGRWLRRFITRLGERAGIEKHVHLHLLRHCFACRLLSQTNNLFMVSKALGHASVATTQVYLHLVDSELESAMKGLGGEI